MAGGEMEEEAASSGKGMICLGGSVVLVSAASAKHGHLISCCLQEAAVCYSGPLVINLPRFNWSAPHCDACTNTHTHTHPDTDRKLT